MSDNSYTSGFNVKSFAQATRKASPEPLAQARAYGFCEGIMRRGLWLCLLFALTMPRGGCQAGSNQTDSMDQESKSAASSISSHAVKKSQEYYAQIDAAVRAAQLAFERKQYAHATRLCSQLLKQEPLIAGPILVLRAKCYLAINNLALAEKDASEACFEDKFRSDEPIDLLARIYRAQGFLKKALTYNELSLGIHPAYGHGHNLGLCYCTRAEIFAAMNECSLAQSSLSKAQSLLLDDDLRLQESKKQVIHNCKGEARDHPSY